MSNSDNNKGRMTTIVAAFAVVIAIVAYFGVKYPMPGDQATGTIAPAERYRGEQITTDDVTLGDESMAKLMQTDIYQEMVENPEVALALTSNAMTQALGDVQVRNALSDADARSALTSSNIANALQERVISDAFANKAVAKVMLSDVALRAAAQGRAALNDHFKSQLRANAELQQALQGNPNLQDALTSGRLADAFTKNNLGQHLRANPALTNALQRDRVVAAFGNQHLVNALGDSNIRAQLSSGVAAAAFNRANLMEALSQERFASQLRNQVQAQLRGRDASMQDQARQNLQNNARQNMQDQARQN